MCDKFHIQWCLYTVMDLWNIISDDDDDDDDDDEGFIWLRR
jgi:hypothetical protein